MTTMSHSSPLPLLLPLLLLGSLCDAAKILALLTTPFPSHNIWSRPLLNGLAARGHQLTVLTAFPESRPHENRHDILMEDVYEHAQEVFEFSNFIQDTPLKTLLSYYLFKDAIQITNERGMASNGSQLLLNSTENFDLIFIDLTYGECFLGFSKLFGYPPVIGIAPYGNNPWGNEIVANPESTNHIPFPLLPFGERMTLVERLINTVISSYSAIYHYHKHLTVQDAIARRHFGDDLPSTYDLGKNISLVFVNSHYSIDYPRPMVPAMIPVGGMHNQPAQELPQDLKSYIEGAAHGVIFFSLGSNMQSDTLSPRTISELLATFRQLPQRVLWKFESNQLPELPANVRVSKWFPQNDVLGHPNVKLFITQAGIFSLQEAVYHGVPLIAIPVFGDQHSHAQKIVSRGIGVQLDLSSLTRTGLLEAINDVINSTSYVSNIQRLSRVFRDQPTSPLERAIYWTEYVIRHKGARHLRSAAVDMPWYCSVTSPAFQFLALDVLLLVLAAIAVACRLGYLLLRALLRLVKKEVAFKLKMQ